MLYFFPNSLNLLETITYIEDAAHSKATFFGRSSDKGLDLEEPERTPRCEGFRKVNSDLKIQMENVYLKVVRRTR